MGAHRRGLKAAAAGADPDRMTRSATPPAATGSEQIAALARSLDAIADRIVAGEALDTELPEISGDDDIAAIAAAADRLVAAVQRSHALEAAVHELFEAMSSHLRLDYLAYEALYRVIDHTQAEGGAIVLSGAASPDIVASVELELEGEALAAVMAQGGTAAGPTQLPPLPDGRPLVAVPFVGDSGPLGVVLLIGVRIDREMCRLLGLLARALGFAVSNAVAHSASEHQAATDPLTGCKNRRSGLEALAQSVRVAGHGGPPANVMMIDLDHFKLINDRYGHQVGDDVLRTVGGTVAQAMRDGDLVVRYGGEEFLVAVSGVDAATMGAVAERLSAHVRGLEVPDGAGAAVALTTSIGVAAWSANATVESLVGRADVALYAAKAGGRDRAVFAAPLAA